MNEPWKNDPIVGDSTKPAPTEDKPWENDPTVADRGGTVGEYAMGAVGGFTKGLIKTLGAPIDISTELLKAVGFSLTEQVGGSEWLLRQTRKAISVPDMPETTTGRILGRTAEEVGATAIPAAGILKKAMSGVPIVKGMAEAVRAPRGLLRESVLDPIKRAPVTATVGETLAATGAGAGAGVAREMFPESPAAETWGQIIGGASPVVLAHGPTALSIRLGRKLWSRFSTKAQTGAAKIEVERLLGGALTEDAKQKIGRAAQLSEKAPGFKPTLAEATGDPSLIATQNAIEREAQGEFLNQVVARKKQNMEAIDRFASSVTPASDVDPEYIVDVATKRIEAFGSRVEAQVAQNVQKQRGVAGGLQTIDKRITGQQIREGIEKARLQTSAKMSVRAHELGIADENMTVQFDEWTNMLKNKYAPVSRFEDKEAVPVIYKQIMAEKARVDAARAAGKEIDTVTTFQDIKTLRERISDDLIDSIGAANPNRRKVRFLTRLKKDTDEFIDSMGSSLGEKYTQFRKEYLEQYVTPYESGVVFKIRSKDGTGFYRSFDETIADQFINTQSGARQYYLNFSENSEMMGALEASIIDRLQKDVVVDGTINAKKLSAWTQKHRGVLDELPEIKTKIKTIESAQDALLTRQNQLAQRRQVVENTALSKQLERVQTGGITPEKILSNAMENPAKMAQLLSLIKKDRAALEGMQRVAWGNATSGSPDEVLKYVKDHQKTLRMLFGAEHFQNINDVVEMRSMIALTDTPKGKAYIPSPLAKMEEKIGMPIPQMATRVYAFKTGRLSKSYLIPEIMRNVVYRKGMRAAESLFKEALYDPAVAREMASAVRMHRMPENKADRLYARLFALILPYTATGDTNAEGTRTQPENVPTEENIGSAFPAQTSTETSKQMAPRTTQATMIPQTTVPKIPPAEQHEPNYQSLKGISIQNKVKIADTGKIVHVTEDAHEAYQRATTKKDILSEFLDCIG